MKPKWAKAAVVELPVVCEQEERESTPGIDGQSYDLVRSADIAAMVKERNEAVERHLHVWEYCSAHSVDLGNITRTHWVGLVDDKNEIIRRIDACFWRRVYEKSGLSAYMSANRRGELEQQIADGTIPEFTPENISATFAELIANAPHEFEEAVCSVFRRLSWDYKTNNPVMFGKRIIMQHAIDRGFRGRPIPAYRQIWDRINDLVRVMRIFAGQPMLEPHQELDRAADGKMEFGEWSEFPDHHVDIKPFKNGNLHIRFRRPDLVAGLNAVVARRYPNALPAAA